MSKDTELERLRRKVERLEQENLKLHGQLSKYSSDRKIRLWYYVSMEITAGDLWTAATEPADITKEDVIRAMEGGDCVAGIPKFLVRTLDSWRATVRDTEVQVLIEDEETGAFL